MDKYAKMGANHRPLFCCQFFKKIGSGELDKELARCGKGAWGCEYQNT
jgi:hypothetical protein